ncbi:MAG: type I restriction-modification system subunit M N-terminal domain-containing protein [Polyangiaceae bacterium]
MPAKRDVLHQFSRDELLAVGAEHNLTVADRSVRDQLVEAVAVLKKATLDAILAPYAPDRLKELCRPLGLDDSGKEKAALIARLTGVTTAAPTKPPKATNGMRAAPESVELPTAGKLTVDALERYLWSAADILRGSIDSSDYRGFIFRLLFLKRLSDRFDEECDALVAEGLDPEDKDEHPFFVPPRARWSAVRKAATDIGETLNKACSALKHQNPALEGILAGIDFNDARKLGDAKNRDVVLGRLVQHFSKVDLRNANLSEPDMLGRAYEGGGAMDAGLRGETAEAARVGGAVGVVIAVACSAIRMRRELDSRTHPCPTEGSAQSGSRSPPSPPRSRLGDPLHDTINRLQTALDDGGTNLFDAARAT